MRTIEEINEMAKGLNIKDKASFIVLEYSKARTKELELIEVIKKRQETEESVTAENSFSKSLYKACRKNTQRDCLSEMRNITLRIENGRVIKSAKCKYEDRFVLEVSKAARTARELETLAKHLNIELPDFRNAGTPDNPVFVKV